MTELKHIDIYTDGACSGNPGKGGWGAILKYKNTVLKHKYVYINIYWNSFCLVPYGKYDILFPYLSFNPFVESSFSVIIW